MHARELMRTHTQRHPTALFPNIKWNLLLYRYAVVLAFDVKIERDAQEQADKEGITIFSAEIIYHLFDQFTAYCEVRQTFCINAYVR